MAPVWVTVLVGLASGVVGTLLSTLLRISHERAAELRSRMLEAADDYVRALDDACRLADEAGLPQVAASFFTHEGELASDEAAAAESAREAAVTALRTVEGLRSRIRLLYGPDSSASNDAKRAYEKVAEAVAELFRFNTDDSSDDIEIENERRDKFLGILRAQIDEAHDALDEFSRDARAAISRSRMAS
jgi:L-2-hydroxyglutarate oxidase LhgO